MTDLGADVIRQTAILKTISDFTAQRYTEQRAKAARILTRGDRLNARSPLDGTKLGAVYMSDPERVCRITDERALTDWMVEHYVELTETGYEVCGSDKEVIAVLFEHAPHLLRQIRRVKADDMRQLRAAAISAGHPVGPGSEADVPGIEVDTPDGVVACKPTEDAFQAVMDLYRARRLQLDGTVLAAIEEA
jgi:hypothetical protein